MNQKWPITDREGAHQKLTGKKTGSKAATMGESPLVQVMELQQLHNPRPAKVRLKTGS